MTISRFNNCVVWLRQEKGAHMIVVRVLWNHIQIYWYHLKNNLPCFLVYYLISTLTTGCLHPLRYFLLFFLLFHRPINLNWKFASIYHIRGKSCFFFRCGDKLPTHRSHRNCNWMPMEFRDLINIFTDHSMSKINQFTNFIYCFFSFHLQIYMWLLFGECKESK